MLRRMLMAKPSLVSSSTAAPPVSVTPDRRLGIVSTQRSAVSSQPGYWVR